MSRVPSPQAPRPVLAVGVTGGMLAFSMSVAFSAPQKPAAPKPAAAAATAVPGKISYETQIQPLLAKKCGACHANGTRLGSFQIDNREALITGGQTHPAVIPGKGTESFLVRLVGGQIPGKIMPAKGPRLTPAEVRLLSDWIDQGASFGSAAGADTWKPVLEPRRPALPQVAGVVNPVDRLLTPYYKARKIVPGAPVDDRAFARRAYLDVIGLLPTESELHAFLADRSLDKRATLARSLLADRERYAEHWLSFWNDLLRNDYAGTGYIDGGRTQITGWLYRSLEENKPYDQFVRELVNPTPESAGFVKGIVWRGVVNASQTPQMQAAQNISQVFMGVNLKCASCHDSFVSTWKLADSYGMAGIYSDGGPLEMVRCDKPQGAIAPIKSLYPQLGSIDGSAPREKRAEQLAGILTNKQHGRLARTLVNRVWGKLMGRGLVEPQDEMDSKPWSPELLDWLAADFQDHGYDVKRLMETILTSRAYALPAAAQSSETAKAFTFTGPVVKRMSAEQFVDAMSQLTGEWSKPATQFRIVKGKPVLPQSKHAQIRFDSGLLRSGSRDIDVDVTGAQVLQLVVTDGGDNANSDWADWVEPRIAGPNGETPLTKLKWYSATTGYGTIQIGKSIVEKPLRLEDKTYADGIGTHANSVITYLLPPGTTRFRAKAGPDTGALEQGNGATSIGMYIVTGDRSMVEARAALALSDPLTRALGRPNREQLVTQRSTVATTLQALELTNGGTLATRLSDGAARWSAQGLTPGALVDRLYEQALCRKPNATERQTALQMVGTPVRKEGVEDLLWALAMLPEFQLVY